jgi:CubicO group peptidase (beta-lactamase class C family)
MGALLPLGGSTVADVTLAELASHRSGLSMQGVEGADQIAGMLRYLRHQDPFTQDLDGLLVIARKATLAHRGTYVYSNLGAALLGQALAVAAQMDYDELVEERLFRPLGMAASRLPLTPGNLASDAPTGYSAAGVAEAPWTLNAWAPAGGARSNMADMVRYAQALLDGSVPGMDALVPRWRVDGAHRVGYAWITQEYQGHTLTVHNGRTGGFASTITLDRAEQRAVIILSNTAAPVEEAASRLLAGEDAWTSSR